MVSKAFFVNPVPPFRLGLTVWALRRRAHNLVDRWDGETYRRSIVVRDGSVAEVSVTQVGPPDRPRLKVETTGAPLAPDTKSHLREKLNRLLGIPVDLQPFYAMAGNDRRLAPLVERFRGVKPPRFPTVFEGLVNGIACQQLSLNVGITLLNRLAERFGAKGAGAHAFPDSRGLARQDPGGLRNLGFSGQKGRALLELASAADDGRFDPEALSNLDDEAAVRRLLQLRGVGRWTAEYVLLRGLGRLEIFPGDDVGARRRLARWLGHSEPLDYAGVGGAVHRWQPYAGMIYFHLLLNGLAENGIIPEQPVIAPKRLATERHLARRELGGH